MFILALATRPKNASDINSNFGQRKLNFLHRGFTIHSEFQEYNILLAQNFPLRKILTLVQDLQHLKRLVSNSGVTRWWRF
jgi:hypothetical protein